MDKETLKAALRELREKKCFAVINRGSFWYETLTEEQVTELREWYKQWLDVTVTFKVPRKPKWLA
jgi:hypothetical protein